uniref:BREX system Lon protease-like protein BrxL n=1 Tax=uncultured Draconibacterium sp. TaxID=1573823 RepID=UPI0032171C42
MEPFENKARNVFSEIIINKSFIHKAGFGARAIPTYVGEWIISHFVGDAENIDEQSRGKMAAFMKKYVPAKGEKESINNQLLEMQEIQMLDNYNVAVNLTKGDRFLSIPFLDLNNAAIPAKIVDENEMLLGSGLWGVGTLFYIPPSDESPKGQVWMKELKPFQIANVDLDYYCESRSHFSTKEWIDFIISSMGFNPMIYDERQKLLLICRLIPLIEPRYNLVELAPKGTGKSYVYDNMSRYVAVRAGNITPAVLFFNDARKTAGLITKYDTVVIDEAQKVKGDSSGELTALLKTYLESGKFGKGTASAVSAEAGIVILANIELDENKKPLNEIKGLFKVFPNFLQETAFIDRFSGFLPGWDLPRVTKETPSKFIGLKGDIFGEILHKLRHDIGYRDYIKANMELIDCDDMRDTKAIEAGATGLMKILFPNKEVSEKEFYEYCVNPAVELRQRVRDELCKMDREYVPITIRTPLPNVFQENHQVPHFYNDMAESDLLKKEEIKESDRSTVSKSTKTNDSDTVVDSIEPIERTLEIKENETGWSYKKIFALYFKDSKEIHCVDPHIKWEYQIRNFLEFCEVLVDKSKKISINLTTSYDDVKQKEDNSLKFAAIKENLKSHNIDFEVDFNESIHDRSIETDDGWRIVLGRGFDIFQKPEYDLNQTVQEKRKCRKTSIDFIKRW